MRPWNHSSNNPLPATCRPRYATRWYQMER